MIMELCFLWISIFQALDLQDRSGRRIGTGGQILLNNAGVGGQPAGRILLNNGGAGGQRRGQRIRGGKSLNRKSSEDLDEDIQE